MVVVAVFEAPALAFSLYILHPSTFCGFLWLSEEVLALLFLLHRKNGDFSILMKDILHPSTSFIITCVECQQYF
jgi:hypothetical protein